MNRAVMTMKRRAGNCDAVFAADQFPPSGRAVSVPARYLGDKARRVVGRYGSTEIEPGLYPERAGQPCRIVEDYGRVPYPLVLDFGNGFRGIARRASVEVLR